MRIIFLYFFLSKITIITLIMSIIVRKVEFEDKLMIMHFNLGAFNFQMATIKIGQKRPKCLLPLLFIRH